MQAILITALLTIAWTTQAQAQNYNCSIFADSTSPEGPEIVTVTVNGPEVHFGKKQRNGKRWGLTMKNERYEGLNFLELHLSTHTQNASVASARALYNAPIIGLNQNNDNAYADIICKRN